MNTVECDGLNFNFPDAIDVFKFDEMDKTKQTFHCGFMKAVDIVAVFKDYSVFIELKQHKQDLYDFYNTSDIAERTTRFNKLQDLKRELVLKYRDSFLYRYAEKETDKPIHYICLLTLDNALNGHIAGLLNKEIPVGKPNPRWKKDIVKSCKVLNFKMWNRAFPKWVVTGIENS